MSKKRINKLGMMDVVDGIRMVSKDIDNAISNWNPPTDDKTFEIKFKLIEISNKLVDWVDDFNNDLEWDVRDDSDSFDSIN
tara:strand:- start:1224 stop:1466 length:243 start_codon:yes stop_codon:yes gene_type:complete